MSIYPNQKRATAEAIDAYNTFNYVILTAQMQSGKTGTSLWIAFNMLINKKVSKAFIISGNRNTSLRVFNGKRKSMSLKIHSLMMKITRVFQL